MTFINFFNAKLILSLSVILVNCAKRSDPFQYYIRVRVCVLLLFTWMESEDEKKKDLLSEDRMYFVLD